MQYYLDHMREDYVNPMAKLKSMFLGTLSSEIGALKNFRRTLLEVPNMSNEDFIIAENLKNSNYSAYKIMEVEYEYHNDKAHELIKDIDFILHSWNDKEKRWLEYPDVLRRIAPYFKEKENIDNVLSVKVHGNSAWKLYLANEKQNKTLRDEIKNLINRINNLKTEFGKDEIDYDESDEYDFAEDVLND
jgi:hypothetical protein